MPGVAAPSVRSIMARQNPGFWALTMSAAREWGRYRINVNSVCFGMVETPMTETIRSEKFADRYMAQIPMGRMSTPEEVAQPVCFLLSNAGILYHRPAPERERWLPHRVLRWPALDKAQGRTPSSPRSWAEGVFEIQKCGGCGTHVFHPRVICPACGSADLGWFAPTGEGHRLCANGRAPKTGTRAAITTWFWWTWRKGYE